MSRETDEADFKVFRTVFFYCVIIIFFPVLTFFSSKLILFDNVFVINSVSSNIASAVCAVIVLHIALGLFIYRAYFEAEKAKPVSKRD